MTGLITLGSRHNFRMLPRNLRPMRLSRRNGPFDSEQFIFELKIDGFRALPHIEFGKGELISRNGNVFRAFSDLASWLAAHLRVRLLVSIILDAPSFATYSSG